MPVNARLVVLLFILSACEKQPTNAGVVKKPASNKQPTAVTSQAPSAATTPAIRARTLVEHKCDITPTYIYLTASFEIESDYLGSSNARHDGPFRDFLEVSCTQCVGEDFSYGNCENEFSWSCESHRIHLNGIDQGKALTGGDVMSYISSKPTKSTKKVVAKTAMLLKQLNDPTRFGYFDDNKKSKLRKRAQRIKDIASTIPKSNVGKGWGKAKHEHALIDLSGDGNNILAIYQGKAHLLFAGADLAYAVADCSSKP